MVKFIKEQRAKTTQGTWNNTTGNLGVLGEERLVLSLVTTMTWRRHWVRQIRYWSRLGRAQTQPVMDVEKESPGKWFSLWQKIKLHHDLKLHPKSTPNRLMTYKAKFKKSYEI